MLTAALHRWAIPSAGLLMLASASFAAPPAGDMLNRLNRDYGYLFTAEERRELDAINRDYREAQNDERRAPNTGAQNDANQRQIVAIKRMPALLEKVSSQVRVNISGDRPVPVEAGTIRLPGTDGALLLRIDGGQAGVAPAYAFARLKIGAAQTTLPSVEVPVGEGITWAVIGISEAPESQTRVAIRFNRGDRPEVNWPAEFVAPPSGRLKLRILSDGDQPCPAMVRLTWSTGGPSDIRPVNAVDLAAQYDAQGRSTSQRPCYLPGLMFGEFWCVPGPLDMPISPGDYTIVVRRGAEHIPVQDRFTVAPGDTVEKTYTVKRWVDMREHGWYSGDDHVHNRILDDADAERLMACVKAEDVHLANIVKMGDIYRTWFEQRGFGKDFRVIDGDYILSPGQECPRTHDQIGHTLAMNTTSMVRDTDKYYSYDWVANTVHEQGGLWGYAHVLSGQFFVHRDMSMNAPAGNVDFAEVLQFGHLGTDLYYDFLNLGIKITASAGSDVPWGGTIGEVRVYAHPEGPFTADSWFDAVERGRTFVSNGPMIDFHVDDALPGDELVVDGPRKLKVKARAWGDPGRMLPVKLEIIRHGKSIQAAESAAGSNEAQLEFEVDADHGFWIAARAEAGGGLRALTTPVYVVRKGLRFWEYQEVDALIAKRLASLDEVEMIVKMAEAAVEQRASAEPGAPKPPPLDRAVEQLAIQGDTLLARVAKARQAYAELQATAAREKAERGAAGP